MLKVPVAQYSMFAALSLLIVSVVVSPSARGGHWPELDPGPRRAGAEAGVDEVALVVAIEDYDLAPDLPGARTNGRAWVSWLTEQRGVVVVKVLEDGIATREEILAAAQGLSAHVSPDGRVWIVFIGHGAPSIAGHGVLVGADARQTARSLDTRSLSLDDLAGALGPDHAEVVVVQDACFSGRTATGDLVPGLAPLLPTSTTPAEGWTVLSAGRSDEFAGPLSDGSRPAFSYLVLGALMGWGDVDRDGVVTAQEAVDWSGRALFQTTSGRTQRPELVGADLALGRAGRSRPPDLVQLAMPVPVGAPAPEAEISLGAHADLEKLAREAADKQAAADAAEHLRREAEAAAVRLARAKQEQRRRLLDEAAEKVRTAAAQDFETIAHFVRHPTAEGQRPLEAYLRRYGSAEVRVDGEVREVALQEVERVRTALARIQRPPREPVDRKLVRATAGYSGAGLLSVGGLALITQAQIARGDIREGLEQSAMNLGQAEAARTAANRTLAVGYVSLGTGLFVGHKTRTAWTASHTPSGGSMTWSLSGVW